MFIRTLVCGNEKCKNDKGGGEGRRERREEGKGGRGRVK